MTRESIYKQYIPAVINKSDYSDLSYLFAFSSNKLLIEVTNKKVSIPFMKNIEELNISPVSTHYLGTLKDHPCYAVELPVTCNEPENMSFSELRALYPILEEDVYLLAGKALQIINWNQTTMYCGKCGSKTKILDGERAKVCTECGFVSYPRLSPAVISAVIKDGKILLAHAKAFQGNMYSIIAGFVEPGETLEECVKRECMEEVGIKVKNIRYFGSQPWPFPNSLMIGFVCEYESGDIMVDGVEIGSAGWFGKDELPEIPSKASIAREIIDWFIGKY